MNQTKDPRVNRANTTAWTATCRCGQCPACVDARCAARACETGLEAELRRRHALWSDKPAVKR